MENDDYNSYLEACVSCLQVYFRTLFASNNDIPINISALFPQILLKLIEISSSSSLKLIELILPHLGPFVIPPKFASSLGGRNILIQLFKRDWFVLDRASTNEGDSGKSKHKDISILGKLLLEIDPKNSFKNKDNVF